MHLPAPFVRHFLRRLDYAEGGLPRVLSVLTMPLVLPDGTLLSGRGLNPECEIVFRVPAELQDLAPKPDECEPWRVSRAMRFLTNEWLVDVAADMPESASRSPAR